MRVASRNLDVGRPKIRYHILVQYYMRGGSGGGGGAKCTCDEKGHNDGEVVQYFVHPPSWISLALGRTACFADMFAELTV